MKEDKLRSAIAHEEPAPRLPGRLSCRGCALGSVDEPYASRQLGRGYGALLEQKVGDMFNQLLLYSATMFS